MNSIQDKLLDWRNRFICKFGSEPKVLQVTVDEKEELRCSSTMQLHYPVKPSFDSFCGYELRTAPFADLARERTLDLDVNEMYAIAQVDEFKATQHHHVDQARRMLLLELRAYIASDTTKLRVEMESDSWAWLKRWQPLPRWLQWSPVLRRWWTVRTKMFTVDCRVLYPHVEVQLPQHPHTVKFAVRP